jgi:hypothetical protein
VRAIVAVSGVLGFFVFSPAAAAEEPSTNPNAQAPDSPAERARKWVAEGDRLLAKARASVIERNQDAGRIYRWLSERKPIFEDAVTDYKRAVEIGEADAWTTVPIALYVYAARAIADYRYDLSVDLRHVEGDFRARQPPRPFDPWRDDLESPTAEEQQRDYGRMMAMTCVQISTAHRYWDENSDACEALLAKHHRSRLYSRFDLLLPAADRVSPPTKERFLPETLHD